MNREQMIQAIRDALKKMESEDCGHHQFVQLLEGLLVDLVLALDPEKARAELKRLEGIIPSPKGESNV